jgi:hypothetical protein
MFCEVKLISSLKGNIFGPLGPMWNLSISIYMNLTRLFFKNYIYKIYYNYIGNDIYVIKDIVHMIYALKAYT